MCKNLAEREREREKGVSARESLWSARLKTLYPRNMTRRLVFVSRPIYTRSFWQLCEKLRHEDPVSVSCCRSSFDRISPLSVSRLLSYFLCHPLPFVTSLSRILGDRNIFLREIDRSSDSIYLLSLRRMFMVLSQMQQWGFFSRNFGFFVLESCRESGFDYGD